MLRKLAFAWRQWGTSKQVSAGALPDWIWVLERVLWGNVQDRLEGGEGWKRESREGVTAAIHGRSND